MSEITRKNWDFKKLELLLGEPESIRQEFKSGRLFDDSKKDKWIEDLSKEISSFANTEGGEVFLGIDEDRKAKPKVATIIDGVSIEIAPETLQRTIEGNISPYLPGIRFQRVQLPDMPSRVVYVIQVPQGNTAYQAKDGRYYGRSEFEAKFLPDHEVRLRMNRGKQACAEIIIKVLGINLGDVRERKVREKHKDFIAKLNTMTPEELFFSNEMTEI